MTSRTLVSVRAALSSGQIAAESEEDRKRAEMAADAGLGNMHGLLWVSVWAMAGESEEDRKQAEMAADAGLGNMHGLPFAFSLVRESPKKTMPGCDAQNTCVMSRVRLTATYASCALFRTDRDRKQCAALHLCDGAGVPQSDGIRGHSGILAEALSWHCVQDASRVSQQESAWPNTFHMREGSIHFFLHTLCVTRTRSPFCRRSVCAACPSMP